MLDATPVKIEKWKIEGELVLNCNCTVFCPCVISLGQHPPTEGACKAWMAVRIDKGKWGRTSLKGVNIAMLLEIPGKMGDGDWRAKLYVDEAATDAQFAALKTIFTGQAGGTTGLFRMLVSTFFGAEREPITFETSKDGVRSVKVGDKISGAVAPVPGADPDKPLVATNTKYWMGADITVASAMKGKVRDLGRVWNFDGKSAEICQISWAGP
jgi:hypothetical protein